MIEQEKSVRGSFENIVGISLPEFAQVAENANDCVELLKGAYLLDQAEKCLKRGAPQTALQCLSFFNQYSLESDITRFVALFQRTTNILSRLEVKTYGKEKD